MIFELRCLGLICHEIFFFCVDLCRQQQMATIPTAIKRRGLKGVSKDGVERINTEKVCLYCGCTDEDEKRFVRVDRMKKGR